MISPLPEPPRSLKARQNHFISYVLSSSLWVAALTLQNLLVSWILLGELREEADVFGQSRALMATPPLIMLLVGGIWGDRVNPRTLLIGLSLLTVVPPILLGSFINQVNLYIIIAFGTAIAILNALSDPVRQALLNRVTAIDIQRSIVIITIFPSLVSIGILSLGYKIEELGLQAVLFLLAGVFLVSALVLRFLPNMSPIPVDTAKRRFFIDWQTAKEMPLVVHVLAMNFVSAIFNAGGYIVAMPLIAQMVYNGDEAFFTTMAIAFTLGATGSNILLYFIMPFKHPGKVFLSLQLTRLLIILLIWSEPPEWFFFVCVCLWGVNMGITSTIVRSTIQEQAPAQFRAQIMSFHLFSFNLASPISAIVLATLIQAAGPLNGLLPGVVISVVVFGYGLAATNYWSYRSPPMSNPISST